MSMKEWCILGYGLSIDQIADYIDRSKLIDFVCSDVIIDNTAEGVDMSNTELVNEYFMEKDSLVEFCYADNVTGYILISSIVPWQMQHQDYRLLTTMEKAKGYIWEQVSEILDGRLTEEDFYLMIDYIDDTVLA